jgi:hypothetical protein
MIPGKTAFPCKHSYFADSQASKLGFPVNPAQLISDRTLFPLKKSRNSKLLKILRLQRTTLITVQLLATKASVKALPTKPLDPVTAIFI